MFHASKSFEPTRWEKVALRSYHTLNFTFKLAFAFPTQALSVFGTPLKIKSCNFLQIRINTNAKILRGKFNRIERIYRSWKNCELSQQIQIVNFIQVQKAVNRLILFVDKPQSRSATAQD